MNSASGLPAPCDRVGPVFEKCDFGIFDFVTLLTGSGNEIQKSGSVRARSYVPSFQK